MFSDIIDLDYWDLDEAIEQNFSNDNNFKCLDCGKIYKYKRGLKYHQRLHCGKNPQFQCNLCSKQFYQPGNLKRHMFLVHGSHKNI